MLLFFLLCMCVKANWSYSNASALQTRFYYGSKHYDLGAYCLQYRLPKNRSRGESREQTTREVLAGKRLKLQQTGLVRCLFVCVSAVPFWFIFCHDQFVCLVIPPANFVCRGYTVFTLSVRASVRASVRPSIRP